MRSLLAVPLALVLMPWTVASAQEWSPAQREIWQVEQACWEHYTTKNLEAGMACFHDDYVGWSFDMPVPGNKADARAFWTRDFAAMDVVWYNLKPVSIKVYGTVAVVHYYFWMTTRSADGDDTTVTGRWTDVLMKQGNRWAWIADSGGPTGS